MNTTAISTTIVEFTTSWRFGQATFFSSARTSARYARGPMFSLLLGSRAGPRACDRPRAACRCPASASAAWSVGSPGHALFWSCRAFWSRAGGTRTPNRRFWRPVLYQLSYCPPRSRRGARRSRIAAGRRTTPSRRPDAGARQRGEERRAAARARAMSTAAAVAPAAAARAPDRTDVGEPLPVSSDRIAVRSDASPSAASVWLRTPGRRLEVLRAQELQPPQHPPVARELGLAPQARLDVPSARGAPPASSPSTASGSRRATSSHRTGRSPAVSSSSSSRNRLRPRCRRTLAAAIEMSSSSAIASCDSPYTSLRITMLRSVGGSWSTATAARRARARLGRSVRAGHRGGARSGSSTSSRRVGAAPATLLDQRVGRVGRDPVQPRRELRRPHGTGGCPSRLGGRPPAPRRVHPPRSRSAGRRGCRCRRTSAARARRTPPGPLDAPLRSPRSPDSLVCIGLHATLRRYFRGEAEPPSGPAVATAEEVRGRFDLDG